MFGNMLGKSDENGAKRSQNGAIFTKKGRPKNVSKIVIDCLLIFTHFGLPRGGPKSDAELFFGVPFGLLGASGSKKGP